MCKKINANFAISFLMQNRFGSEIYDVMSVELSPAEKFSNFQRLDLIDNCLRPKFALADTTFRGTANSYPSGDQFRIAVAIGLLATFFS
jgi:hypothetical protein